MSRKHEYVDQNGKRLNKDEIEVVEFISKLGEQNKPVYRELTIESDVPVSTSARSDDSRICLKWAVDPRNGNLICIKWS